MDEQLLVYRYVGPTTYVNSIELFEDELVLINEDKVMVGHTLIDVDKLDKNNLQYIKTVSSQGEFNLLKNDDNWQRLCPYENREDDGEAENSRKTSSGFTFHIRKIEQ